MRLHLLFRFGCNEAHLRCMKNEVALRAYEACLRHIGMRKCVSLHTSDSSRFMLAKPMLHFSLKRYLVYVMLNFEGRCYYA